MRNDHDSRPRWTRRPVRKRWVLGLTAAMVALAGCDSLLDVKVPQSTTDDDFFQPYNSIILARSVAGTVECSYSRFVSGNASGNADVFQQIDLDLGNQAVYDEDVGGGNTCDSGGDEGYDWFEPFQIARQLGVRTYDALVNDWSADEVEQSFSVEGSFGSGSDFESIDEIRAFIALYTAIPFQVYGEYMCEVAYDGGPLVAPDSTLQIAENYVDNALQAIGNLTDPNQAMPYGITTGGGYSDFAHALRARIRWARGDLAGAASDAMMVSQGFVANATRGTGVDQRYNDVYVAHYQEAYNTVTGPITTAEWNPAIRTNPVTSTDWPDTIPFTGYLDLMIDADGRAITAAQHPITGANAGGGAVADTRVAVELDAGSGHMRPTKYPTGETPIPLLNWEEAWLIQAEANPAGAVALVNEIRTAHSLPVVDGASYNPTTADEIEDMIIEERRRSLFLEGRFWATKLHNTDKLWFPRSNGLEPAPNDLDWGGAVRMVMQEAEFNVNPNASLGERNTLCPTDQQAVVSID